MTVLTGYLGAGKTTLLNRIQVEPHEVRCHRQAFSIDMVRMEGIVPFANNTTALSFGPPTCGSKGITSALGRLVRTD